MAGSIFATRPETAPVPSRKPPAKAQSVGRVMATLRAFFEQRPFSVLLGCFREQDLDGSGQLELPEFTRALKSLNIDLSEADIAGVFAALDSDGSGVMELKEFLNELKSEPDPREAQWLRLGIGHQYVEPNRAPPSTLGVKHEPWLSGFNRGNRVLVDGDKSLVQEKPPATAADIGEHGDGAETALLLLRDFFSRRSVAVLMSIFQDVDVDNSGRIDVDEFGTALHTQHGQSATHGGAPARPLRLLRAHLAASCSSALPGWAPASGVPAKARHRTAAYTPLTNEAPAQHAQPPKLPHLPARRCRGPVQQQHQHQHQHRHAMRCNAMQCDVLRCNAMHCNAMRCNAMQCDALRCTPPPAA